MFWYVANAGIVFCFGKTRIGIDCLCKDSSGLYQDTPMEIRENLNVDVLVFTHEHNDHFCAEYVKEAWGNNPALRIYANSRAIRSLKEKQIPSENLFLLKGDMVSEIQGIRMNFVQTIHEGEEYSDVENMAVLIESEGRYFVHTGDAKPSKEFFERVRQWACAIDWMFVPFPYVGLGRTRRLIKDTLDVANIFVLHQPQKEADVQHWVRHAKQMCSRSDDGLPQPIFPETIGNFYEF